MLHSSIASCVARLTANAVEEAVKQYKDLKATEAVTHNFDEGELNTLGYNLVRSNKVKDAIRIFQLNVDAYPQSSNAYDSLAAAYADDGDSAQAIANYQKSLQLNPHNRSAALWLQKRTAP